MAAAKPVVLEPIMNVEVSVPAEYQGATVAGLSQRKGIVSQMDGAEYVTIDADVPLANMFGYIGDLRSQTQGKGEFTMEYKKHFQVPREKQEEMVKAYQEKRGKKAGDDDDD